VHLGHVTTWNLGPGSCRRAHGVSMQAAQENHVFHGAHVFALMQSLSMQLRKVVFCMSIMSCHGWVFLPAAQDKLCSSSILIIGAGGLGAPCALYLAAAGVGKTYD
jgi:hypothetical protein